MQYLEDTIHVVRPGYTFSKSVMWDLILFDICNIMTESC